MKHEPVESSNIESIGYDEASLTCEVQFRNGARYRYLGVLPGHHKALMEAESKGKHLHAHFKGVYTCERLNDAAEVDQKVDV